MTYRVIITGSREYQWRHRVYAYLDMLLAYHPDLEVVVGDCASGADRFACQWATEKWVPIERHEADWELYGLKAGPIRNSGVAKAGAEQCVGFWFPTESRKHNRGTRDMCSKAFRMGIPVLRAYGDQAPVPWGREYKAGGRNTQGKP